MSKRRFPRFMRLLLIAAVSWTMTQGVYADNGKVKTKPDRSKTTPELRKKARLSQAKQKKGVALKFAGVSGATAAYSPLATGPSQLATMTPLAQPDYFGVANWVNSPLPTVPAAGALGAINLVDPGSGYVTPVVTITDGGTGSGATATATVDAQSSGIASITLTAPGSGYTTPVVAITDADPNVAFTPATATATFATVTGGMRKFVDPLPGIPFATADTTTFPGSDYYKIGLKEYAHQFHSDLPATKVRGYRDLGNQLDSTNHYLGPLIVATRNRPVRVLFQNEISLNLNLPVDTTYMGAGMVSDGTNSALASTKRATLHLHGGATPWISDGTTMQWITPSGGDGQPGALGFAKGFSFQNVPDMVPPGCSGAQCVNLAPGLTDGQGTFYWTNQQSGRLMFFHDHAYGITRLNVYGGEAAGYLLVDPVQESALKLATVPGTIVTDPLTGEIQSADLAHVVPLVIQDKTFVPDDGEVGGQLAATDPTWDVANFGGKGSLWFPHVYMPNQNPADISGSSAFGRWDYGPWFWPPQDPSTFVPEGQPYPCISLAYDANNPPAFPPLMCPGTPNPSGTPEAFMDTPVVNGTAYPRLDVNKAAYRFQILSAGNDRTWNLQLYYAVDSRNGRICNGLNYNPGDPNNSFDPAFCTEVSLVPAFAHTATSVPPLCSQPTLFPPMGGHAIAALDPITGVPIGEGTGLPQNCWPTTWPTDGRDGGVPDPLTAGPAIIQIGAEGGLLPAPAVIPSTPIGYEYARRSITVLNLFTYGLLLGPAERADVIVDFSRVPENSVLILYNDAPAPVPAFDSRTDYYTGDPDQSDTGGAPTTQPGYGPNTRTVMQIRVGAPELINAFDLPTLTTALPAVFQATQDPIIVPETAYGAAQNAYARIQDNSMTGFFGGPIGAISLTSGGAGYTGIPTVTIDPPTSCGSGAPDCVTATATATINPTSVASVSLTAGGAGYTSAPTVSFANGGGGTGAAATAVLSTRSVASITVTKQGSNYTTVPTVTISAPPAGTTATATATVVSRKVTAITVTNPGSGYVSAPTVTITGGGGSGATATAALAPTSVASVNRTAAGSGYTSAPTVSFSGGGGSGAAATATLTPTVVTGVTLTNAGNGYRSAPAVTFSAPTGLPGSTATAQVTAPVVPLLPKTIQELFTLDYGRMNATLGVELPFTNFLTQTTIPYAYIDPPTELFKEGETQLWKITHNGVDTHFIHFHLFTVQVVNRCGWDGAIKPPNLNELGWKDTVRMNPLEDIVVAIKPIKPIVPFDLPNSIRPMDVTMPIGSSTPYEFTNVDPANHPATVQNAKVNFGWEYVWHCHILGHEENDMMRPIGVALAPAAPSAPAAVAGRTSVALTWTDQSVNETGFTVQRATSANGPWSNVATVASATGPAIGGAVAYTDTTVARRTTYIYRVIANNVVGFTQTYAAPAVGYPHVSADSVPSGTVSTTTQ